MFAFIKKIKVITGKVISEFYSVAYSTIGIAFSPIKWDILIGHL